LARIRRFGFLRHADWKPPEKEECGEGFPIINQN